MPPFLGPAILGAIGTVGARYYQKKSFEKQDETEKRRIEVQRATEVFERLSAAMDKRLYAMRRVNWSLALDYIDEEEETSRWQAYNEVLVDWNSNLSKNLAMNVRYFGDDSRAELAAIQQSFSALNKQLSAFYYKTKPAPKDFDREADKTNAKIYLINRKMTRMIQEGNVGSFLEGGKSGPTAAEKPDYRSLQEDLNRILGTQLEIDGAYGRKTGEAVEQFQRKFGLAADGMAGPKTRAKIREVLDDLSPRRQT